MRRVVVMLMLMLLVVPGWTQQSSGDESESMICLSASEWDAMEAEVLAEVQRTALEAAEAAVKPHLEYEAKLEATIEEQEDWLTFWKVTTGIGAGMTVLFAVLWLVSSNLGPVP